MKNRTLQHTSRFSGKRRLSVSARKRAVQYWLLGLKTEQQLFQQYGLNRNLLWNCRRWYWQHFEKPYRSLPKLRVMRSKEKALMERIKQLEKKNKELEKALDWEQIKSLAFETMIQIAEDELDITIKKKPGAKPSEK